MMSRLKEDGLVISKQVAFVPENLGLDLSVSHM